MFSEVSFIVFLAKRISYVRMLD